MIAGEDGEGGGWVLCYYGVRKWESEAVSRLEGRLTPQQRCYLPLRVRAHVCV